MKISYINIYPHLSSTSEIAILIYIHYAGLILGLCPANERRRYFVTTSLIGWTHT